jgi:hypothetical protein
MNGSHAQVNVTQATVDDLTIAAYQSRAAHVGLDLIQATPDGIDSRSHQFARARISLVRDMNRLARCQWVPPLDDFRARRLRIGTLPLARGEAEGSFCRISNLVLVRCDSGGGPGLDFCNRLAEEEWCRAGR